MAIEQLAHRDEAGGNVGGTAAGRDGGTLEEVGVFHTPAAALPGLALIAATRGQLGYRPKRATPAAPSGEGAVAGVPSPASGRG